MDNCNCISVAVMEFIPVASLRLLMAYSSLEPNTLNQYCLTSATKRLLLVFMVRLSHFKMKQSINNYNFHISIRSGIEIRHYFY